MRIPNLLVLMVALSKSLVFSSLEFVSGRTGNFSRL